MLIMKQTIEMCAVRLDRMGIKRFTATTPLKEGWAGTSDIYHWWVALILTSLECESMHMLWRWSNHLCNFLKHDPRAFGQGQRTWMVRLTMWNVLTKHVQWKDERTEEIKGAESETRKLGKQARIEEENPGFITEYIFGDSNQMISSNLILNL